MKKKVLALVLSLVMLIGIIPAAVYAAEGDPKVTLTVTSTEPAVRGDTARSATKDATLETGLTVRVPLFIEEGEEVLVRTDTGEYDSRA